MNKPPCTVGCVINTLVSGDHAYCTCLCHPTEPAVPPSRERGEPLVFELEVNND